MSARDDLPYCGDCGMNHEGIHAPAEFCPVDGALLIFEADEADGIPYCQTSGCPNGLAAVQAYADGRPTTAWPQGEPIA